MKIFKKISAVLLALCLCVSCFSMTSYAAGGRISFTDPETKVGDMVEVRCVLKASSGSVGDVELKLAYDASYLRFDSGKDVTAAGSGALTYSGSGGSNELSFTMTFQALQEGSTQITISESSVSMDKGSSTVKIGAGDPSKIVQASANDIEVEVNGSTFFLTDTFADADIPNGYIRTTVALDGSDRQMVMNEGSGIYLGYLINSENVGDFYMYNAENATFAPYEEVMISDTTSIIILSDTSQVDLPEAYQEAKLTLNGKDFPVWQDTANEGYYIIYAMTNAGETGYYQYDTKDGTYQRFELPSEEEEKEVESGWMGKIRAFIDEHLQILVLAIGIGGILLLLILIIVSVKLRNRNLELDDLYDEYGIDLEEEEEVKPAKKNKKEKASKKSGRGKYDDYGDFDDFEEDDFDDYEDEDEYDDYDEYDEYEEDDFDDFEEELNVNDADFRREFEDDIFADENLNKYDTRSYHDVLSFVEDEEDDIDDLDSLLNDVQNSKPKKKEEKSFQIDFIDLD